MKAYTPQNLVPRVEFCVESESEVQNAEFPAPGAKIGKTDSPKKCVEYVHGVKKDAKSTLRAP